MKSSDTIIRIEQEAQITKQLNDLVATFATEDRNTPQLQG